MNLLISVIVPIYNVEKYLSRCLDSILAQTYKNLEIILVNDGSTDGSGKICEEYKQKDSRIVVVHKKNGGLSSARNAGLDIATGSYIGFVDSDDYISLDMYELLIQKMLRKDDIANIMYVRSYDSGKIVSSCVPHTMDEEISSETYLEELLLHIGDVSVCSKLFSKELIGNSRFVEGVLNEDLLFIIEIIKRIHSIQFIGSVGYYYFVREKSISSGYGKAIIDMQKNSLFVLKFVEENFPKLKKQAFRFALYQNMAYLLAIPKQDAKKDNETYYSALRFVRKNTIKNLFNSHLKKKEKIILLGLMVIPKFMALKFQQKHR